MEELKDQLNDLLEIAKHAASEAGQFLVSSLIQIDFQAIESIEAANEHFPCYFQ